MSFGILKEIKNFFIPDTPKVSESSNVTTTKNSQRVPMVGENKEKPVDKAEFKANSRDKIYNKIAEICEEYRINIEEAKKANLLEAIAGVDDITRLSRQELENVITAFKDALGITGSWKWLWQDRDLKDIESIKKDANQRLIHSKTGGFWLGQIWHDITTGALNIEEFKAEIQKIKNLPDNEKKEAYAAALEKYGYSLKNATLEEKRALAGLIADLCAADRDKAVDATITSCGDDKNTRSKVASAVEENRAEIVSKKDGFNNRPSKDDATKIATMTFGNMNEEDTNIALNNMDARTQEIIKEMKALEEKAVNGALTHEESARLAELRCLKDNYSVSGYSGAMIAIPNNNMIENSSREALIKTAFDGAERNGIAQDVCSQVTAYINKHPEAVKGSEAEFIKTLNKATNNKFSQVAEANTSTQENNYSNEKPEQIRKAINQTKLADEPVDSKVSNNKLTSEKETSFEHKNKNIFTEKTGNGYSKTASSSAYTTNTIQQNKNNPFVKVSQNPTTEKAEKTSNDIVAIAKVEGIEGINKEIESKGASTVVTEIYNNIRHINDNAIVLKAEKIYKSFEPSRQADILRSVGNEGLNELLKVTSNDALKMLQGETFANYWATQQVENAVQEVREKEQNQNENLLV